jgi:hypothetical protein
MKSNKQLRKRLCLLGENELKLKERGCFETPSLFISFLLKTLSFEPQPEYLGLLLLLK